MTTGPGVSRIATAAAYTLACIVVGAVAVDAGIVAGHPFRTVVTAAVAVTGGLAIARYLPWLLDKLIHRGGARDRH